MIWLDDDGHIVIRTELTKNDMEQVIEMRKSITFLLQTQDKDFYDREQSYNAFELLSYLEFQPDQICLKK